MTGNDEHFYDNITPFQGFSAAPALSHYVPAPTGWAIVYTDIAGSTRAIQDGRYRDVNALGVASIVGVRNAMRDLGLPFVFGGDGATILIPLSRRKQAEAALRGLTQIAATSFGLEIRTGIVPVTELQKAGHEVLVGKFQSSRHITLASLAGSGIYEGERLLKDSRTQDRFAVPDGPADIDLAGFECRWKPVESRKGTVMSLLISSLLTDPRLQAATYTRLINAIERIVDSEDNGCPVTRENLAMLPLRADFRQEAQLKCGQTRGTRLLVKRLRAQVASLVSGLTGLTGWTIAGFNYEKYVSELVVNTDFRKFDGTVRMVIDVTPAQRDAIFSLLAQTENANQIAWGAHCSNAALMTCLVGNYIGDHVHFVDGNDGGYAIASIQMKAQLRRNNLSEHAHGLDVDELSNTEFA